AFLNSSQPCRRGNKEKLEHQFLQTMQVGGGPNTKAGGKSAYINVQVGVGQRNKFCKNIISVPLPPIFKYTLAVVNDKEPLHHKSLMVLYQFLPPSYVLYF
ncbi:hypothetical protein, partial [Staphylococcus aureus]|uniref:hypothetical protein n=1 Tax=Staphylococcus aureus TaxID=1280 RepID=UPI001B3134CA